jgi:hypothetical protein
MHLYLSFSKLAHLLDLLVHGMKSLLPHLHRHTSG